MLSTDKQTNKQIDKLTNATKNITSFAITVFFAHLLILQYPDHHQNLISSSLYYSGPVHKFSSQSVHNFLSNVVHRQTNKQTNKQTDKQTNQRYQKHNLLCQGGNYTFLLIQHNMQYAVRRKST